MSLVAASRSSNPSRSILSSLFSRTSFASAFFGEGRRGFDGDFLVDMFVLFWLFQDYREGIIHRRDAEFAWFERSRSIRAGFPDGLSFRARRGITMSGILHKPSILSSVEGCVLSASAVQFSSRASQDTQNKVFLLTCVASEYSFYFAEKVFHADWLTLVAVKPFSQHRLPLVRHGRCRDGDDQYAFRPRIGLELLQRRDAVHAWELDVHHDESGKLLNGEPNPLFGCLSLNGLVTLNPEHVAHELSVFLVVFDDEDQLICHKSSDNSPAKAQSHRTQ